MSKEILTTIILSKLCLFLLLYSLKRSEPHYILPYNISLTHYINDIKLIGQDKQGKACTLEALVRHMVGI